MGQEVLYKGRVSETLPPPDVDGGRDGEPVRLGRYGEQAGVIYQGARSSLAREGSYFIATNPVPGTGIAEFSVNAAFADTRGFIIIENTDKPKNQAWKRIELDYIRLILIGTAPATTTALQFAAKRSLTTRHATTAANSTVQTPVNVAGQAGRASIARITTWNAVAAMTIPASSNQDPVVWRTAIPTGLGITGDEYEILFGGERGSDCKPGATAVRATDPAKISVGAPPCIIEPGEFLSIHRWWLTETTTPPTFEYEIAWWER